MPDKENLKTLEGVRAAIEEEQAAIEKLRVQRLDLEQKQAENVEVTNLQNELARLKRIREEEEARLEAQKEASQLVSSLSLTTSGTVRKGNEKVGYDFTGQRGYVPVSELPEGQPPTEPDKNKEEGK